MSGLICLLQLAFLQILPLLVHANTQQWINHGGDLYNSRHATHEQLINTTSVSKLKLKWRFVAGFDISATPALYNGVLYFPSWNGNLYAVNAKSGTLVWMKNLTEVTGILRGDHQRGENTTLARATPTIADNGLIVGLYGPSVVLAVDRCKGDLLWMKQVDNHPGGVITMSGTYYNGSFYIGTSSIEENDPSLCCTFQGSFLKMDAKTGNILWRTLLLPDNNGLQGLYSGAPVWGSSPSIDVQRNLVFIATGNNYGVPPAIAQCQAEQNNMTKPDSPDPCIVPGNHLESILALDLDTGNITWSHQLGGYDAWVASCSNSANGTRNPNCPTAPNPDYDFSDCPSMITIDYQNQSMRQKRDVVVAAQKSGDVWAVDRDTGEIVWSAVTGPGGGGGQVWGTATDSKTIFVNVPNARHKNWTLVPTSQIITTGGWAAINANSGEILWSVANPTQFPAIGPTSLVNGVVFGTSMDTLGSVFALDGKSGDILWNATTNASVYGGCSIGLGCIFVGSGASTNVGQGYNGTRGDSLYAFCLDT